MECLDAAVGLSFKYEDPYLYGCPQEIKEATIEEIHDIALSEDEIRLEKDKHNLSVLAGPFELDQYSDQIKFIRRLIWDMIRAETYWRIGWEEYNSTYGVSVFRIPMTPIAPPK